MTTMEAVGVMILLGVCFFFLFHTLYTEDEENRQLKLLLHFKGLIYKKEMDRLTGAVAFFRERQSAFPGDCPCPSLGRPGNGNGRVEAGNGESGQVFAHLRAAGVLAGPEGLAANRTREDSDPAGRLLSGVKAAPGRDEFVIGSRVLLEWIPDSPERAVPGAHWFVLESMAVPLARHLDEKYDDGDLSTGSIRLRNRKSGTGDLLARLQEW